MRRTNSETRWMTSPLPPAACNLRPVTCRLRPAACDLLLPVHRESNRARPDMRREDRPKFDDGHLTLEA